ncbi:MAG: sigma-54-dependent transcriptional regulator [Bacteroidota bacterium]
METTANNRLIFIVEDDELARKLLEQTIHKHWGYTVKSFPSGEECLQHIDDLPDLILSDIIMPGMSGIDLLKEIKRRNSELPVIMLSAQDRIDVALETIKLGAIDYFCKPLDIQKLGIAMGNSIRMYDLARENWRLHESLISSLKFDNILSNHDSMKKIFALMNKVKDNDIAVLIQGESGTGKELVAKAIHFNGNRAKGPFVVVNCASIPKELLESELFGHERGSFTGAYQKKIGKFEQAHTGTIFLDEIGDMDIALQVKILRVLQLNQFERVGGTEILHSDIRIISATNRNLNDAVANKIFREDLYYRLASFPIYLPPLRDRRSDIPLLAEYFLNKFTTGRGKPLMKFSKQVIRILHDYSWPGNIRELEHAIERAVIINDGDTITEHSLPTTILNPETTETPEHKNNQFDSHIIRPIEELREAAIRHALKVTGGNVYEAAGKLKLGRATLYRLMEKYKIG